MNKEDILDFISARQFTVIATKSEPFPESACIEFGNDGFTLIFDTHKDSRKFKNIQQSPEVSLVIGWDDEKTVQYEGTASLLRDSEELEQLKKAYFKKSPEAKKWENKEGMVYFKVEPKWVRYTDLNKTPWEIVELRF
jgi:general stress protein 26